MPSLPVSRGRALVLAGGLLLLLVVAGRTLADAGASSAKPAAALLPDPAVAAASRLVVHVTGAVSQPGLYRLKEGSRVADAVARAGGATASADTAAVNLAAPLADGMQVLIPSRVAGAAGTAAVPGRVSLNAAGVAELDELPGIGPVTAQKIVDFRTAHGAFKSVDDLDAIPGIGPTRVDQLRDLVGP
jgi:competence protein ComEA